MKRRYGASLLGGGATSPKGGTQIIKCSDSPGSETTSETSETLHVRSQRRIRWTRAGKMITHGNGPRSENTASERVPSISASPLLYVQIRQGGYWRGGWWSPQLFGRFLGLENPSITRHLFFLPPHLEVRRIPRYRPVSLERWSFLPPTKALPKKSALSMTSDTPSTVSVTPLPFTLSFSPH